MNAEGASQLLKSWSVEVTDEKGVSKYYGPYYTDRASVPGSTILGDNASGNYKIIMTGETVTGRMIKKESSVSLMKKKTVKKRVFAIAFSLISTKQTHWLLMKNS